MLDQLISQSLLNNAAIGIKISDCAGRILETNPAFCRFVGHDKAALLGMTVTELCHAADRECELNERRRLIDGHRDHSSFRKRYINSSGRTVWGDTNLTAVRDADGNCQAVVAMVVDVTEQRRLQLLQTGQAYTLGKLYREDSLEEVCKAIVESIEAIEEGLLCSILQLNATTGTLHKVAAPSLPDFYNAAIEGMRIGDGVGSCGTAAFCKQRVIVTDILTHPYWAKARRLVEQTSLRACWSQPIFDRDGNVLGTFAIYYQEPRDPGPVELELISAAADLTALAINHKKALAVLRKSDQLKSEFISTAAHELRTPISSIMGFAELLQEPLSRFSSEQKLSFVNEIIEGSERLTKIIDDLLDLSRIESGYRLPLNREPTSLTTLLNRVVNRFQLKASHRFSMEIAADVPDIILIDQHRISQVLENLLSNAVKYSPRNSCITLRAVREGGNCRISIIDQGIGMTDEQLVRIFDKFYRANSADTAIRGLGLGMSIVRQIIEEHAGSIRVESTPGQGSQVHVTLPLPG